MTRSVVRLLACISIALPGLAVAQVKQYPLESTKGLKLHNVVAEAATLQGKKGLRVTVVPAVAGDADAELLAWLDGVEFSSGVIEAEVAGAPGPGGARPGPRAP